MISIPSPDTLQPTKHNGCYLFPSASTPLLKLDILFEAGSAYQHRPLCAAATSKLLSVATTDIDALRLAEFLDFRGIVIETNSDIYQSALTVYMLRRFADEALPIVKRMITQPAFNSDDLLTWGRKKKNEIAALEQQTPHLARRLFYRTLFGDTHPLGRYATPDDADRLTPDDLRRHFDQCYLHGPSAIVLSGDCESLDGMMDDIECVVDNTYHQAPPATPLPLSPLHYPLPSATQTSIRIGRILPLRWDDPDYADLTLLTTLLGGYFGSRLMSNLREDKGYTYGIYSQTQIFRDSIILFITADVAAQATHDAVKEINLEIERLRQEPVSDAELERVRNFMMGDFIRSIDGTFEISERYRQMVVTDVDERLSANLMETLATVTPAELHTLAQSTLTDLVTVTAGA